jgi:XTP/dITP diphosphohydrolase
VFFLPEHGKTMAQLLPEVKNVISHRARAARGMALILEEIMGRDDV